MNTPIVDFIEQYQKKGISRLHMPGHKGKSFMGAEAYDITEVKGADELYEASGVIAESEKNAAALFETGITCYSTEGSSQCIRAMLYLVMTRQRLEERPYILAARNVHKSFVQAVALLDLDVEWMESEEAQSICKCEITPAILDAKLKSRDKKPIAVYVTSPDYLGGMLQLKGLADVCHLHGTILAVDNAHGAYLKFLEPSLHPIDLGADICCDSAHKTLPVLTGGAYLHIHKRALEFCESQAKQAMALFGSTSPSYLTLLSLDYCNDYLANGYKEKLKETMNKIRFLKEQLRVNGWKIAETDPLKITICVPDGSTGEQIAERLRKGNVECEYADPEYVVCMATPENTDADFAKLERALGINQSDDAKEKKWMQTQRVRKMSVREAMLRPHETIDVETAMGRICGAPTVSCPPAIPIVVSGEVIEEQDMEKFCFYGIKKIDVVIE